MSHLGCHPLGKTSCLHPLRPDRMVPKPQQLPSNHPLLGALDLALRIVSKAIAEVERSLLWNLDWGVAHSKDPQIGRMISLPRALTQAFLVIRLRFLKSFQSYCCTSCFKPFVFPDVNFFGHPLDQKDLLSPAMVVRQAFQLSLLFN